MEWGEGPNGISLAEGQARYRRDGHAHRDEPPHFAARPPRDDEPLDPEWSPFVGNDEPVTIGLTVDKCSFMASTLVEWCHLLYVTAPLASVSGFESVAQLRNDIPKLAKAIAAGDSLSRRGWTQSLLAAEMAWASQIYGFGSEVESNAGIHRRRDGIRPTFDTAESARCGRSHGCRCPNPASHS